MPSARPALLAVVAAAALPAVAPAQTLDPEPNVPYQVRVVIQAKPHPLLSPGFRDQVRRDILAALQPVVDKLGTVEVVDLDAVPVADRDPLWQEFADKGFAALDAPRDLTGVKTHFLRLELRDGAYHLEARQHDGFAGLASPVVRKQTTRAPELVGRAAGLLIDKDFGPVGTVEAGLSPAEVTVRFKAAGLGPLDRLVGRGDVLAVAQINKTARTKAQEVRSSTGKLIAPAGGAAAAPPALLPDPKRHVYTLLRVAEDPKDGAAKCTVLTSAKNPFAMGGTAAGFRCMKLGTVAAPVAVRLVGGNGTAAATAQAAVRATDTAFGPGDPRDTFDFDPGARVYKSGRPLAGVALVTVRLGATREERFPVPVLGADPIGLRFEIDAAAEEKAGFERDLTSLASRTADARQALRGCFDAVSAAILAGKNADALARARGGHAAADTAEKLLTEEAGRLQEQAAKSPAAAALLRAVQDRVAALKKSNADLLKSIGELSKAVDGGAAVRNQAAELNTTIQLLLSEGKAAEAIAAYKQILTQVPEAQAAGIRAKLQQLEADWKPTGDAHARARDYLELKWPLKNTLADLRDSLPELKANVEVCAAAKDKYALRRLQGDLAAFPTRLDDLTRDLDPTADAAAVTAGKQIQAEVSRIEQEVAKFVAENPL